MILNMAHMVYRSLAGMPGTGPGVVGTQKNCRGQGLRPRTPAKSKKVKNQKLRSPGKAKTEEVVPVARRVIDANRRAAEPGVAEPAAAPIHPVRAR